MSEGRVLTDADKAAFYPIPDAIFEQHSAWLATSGAGKTTAVKGAVERMLARRERVVIIDPTGVWWGLRFLRDGRRASPHEVVIFGREHADLPLDPAAGEAIGKALGTASTSAILSLKGLRVSERTRFVTDLFETLVAENRGILNLVIDEVHLFAPQSGGTGLTPAMLHATNNLVATGRAAGLRIAMISQRPAKVHKDSLTQAASIIALRCSHPLDQKPIRDWLTTIVPDKARRAEIMATLAGLPTGEGWLSAPQQGLLERLKFPMIETFDSSRPGVEAIPLKPLDVAALREALVAPASDSPPTNRAKKGSITPGAVAGAEDLAAAEQRGYERGFADGETRGLERGAQAGWTAGVTCLRRDLDQYARSISSLQEHDDGEAEIAKALGLNGWPSGKPASGTTKTSPKYAENYAEPNSSEGPKAGRQPVAKLVVKPSAGGAGLNSAGQKMLKVLDTNPPVRRSWQQVATLAGLKARGGHFNAGKKALLDTGLVRLDGGLVAIAKPSAEAGPEVRDPAALVERWCSALTGAAPQILRAVYQAQRDRVGLSRLGVAELLGLVPRGGHWNAAWKQLRDNGLVTVDGDAVRLGDLS